MSEVLTPVKATPTTTPKDTFIEVEHALGEGVLLYRPDENAFIALYPDEWLLCRKEALDNKTAIEELQEANKAVTEKSQALQRLLEQPNSSKDAIAQARKELDAALNTLSKKSEVAKKRVEAITNQKTDPKKLVEIVPLTLKRFEEKKHTPIYVSAESLKKAMADKRVYIVEGPAERKKPPKEKLIHEGKLNTGELRKRMASQVQDKAKFSKKWKLAPKDADAYSGILFDWAKVMGADATAFLERGQKEILEGILGKENTDPNNPYRIIDMKPEAQFMRWSAGAGVEANFLPFQGNLFDARDKTLGQRAKRAAKAAQFNIKANAEASFAIGEAKVETMLYLPHAAGWHLDSEMAGTPLDFGYFRLRGDLSLYALAGASIALEAGAALMVTGDKQGLKGTPKDQSGAKAKVGAKAEAKVFAGLKEGVSLAGALQWLNPEGYSKGTPKKADPSKAVAAYTDLASVTGEASLIQGLAANLGFECDYRGGNFVIAAKAGGCLGLGGSGSVSCKVGTAQIADFFMCIAHQLKQVDYRKVVGLMRANAFVLLNQMFFLNVAVDNTLESFGGVGAREIKRRYDEATQSLQQNGEMFLKEVENRLRAGWGWYPYMPPEARGALIKVVTEVTYRAPDSIRRDLRKVAGFIIDELLATTQSLSHLENTLDRVTVELGQAPGRHNGVALINEVVADTRYARCIDRCIAELGKAAPLIGRPFLRNDEPEFRLAQFPLHHPAYDLIA